MVLWQVEALNGRIIGLLSDPKDLLHAAVFLNSFTSCYRNTSVTIKFRGEPKI